MEFIPLHNAVVVKPLPQEEKQQHSLLIRPGTALHAGTFEETGGTVGDYTDQGIVVKVGDGYKYGRRFIPAFTGSTQGKWEDVMHSPPLPLEAKVGDRVLYEHKGGEDHQIDGGKLRIVSERHIIAVLEPETAVS